MDVSIYLNRIISGYQNIIYNNTIYKLHNPNIEIKISADILYETIYQEYLFTDFILKDDISDILISTGIFQDNFKEMIKSNQKRLSNTKIDLFKNFFTPNLRNKNKNLIDLLNKTLNDQYTKEHSLDFLTLENFCENIKNEYIISQTLADSDGCFIFKDYPNIEHSLFNNIIQKITNNIIDIKTYKEIVRSEIWKKMISSGYNNIFSGYMSSYTEEQKNLISISQLYDKIYNHPECPPDDIIKDDDALDGWMLHQQEQIKLHQINKTIDKNLGKNKNAGEVFMMATNRDQADDILSMNTPEALEKIRLRSKITESTDDVFLADTQNDIRQQIQLLNKRK